MLSESPVKASLKIYYVVITTNDAHPIMLAACYKLQTYFVVRGIEVCNIFTPQIKGNYEDT